MRNDFSLFTQCMFHVYFDRVIYNKLHQHENGNFYVVEEYFISNFKFLLSIPLTDSMCMFCGFSFSSLNFSSCY